MIECISIRLPSRSVCVCRSKWSRKWNLIFSTWPRRLSATDTPRCMRTTSNSCFVATIFLSLIWSRALVRLCRFAVWFRIDRSIVECVCAWKWADDRNINVNWDSMSSVQWFGRSFCSRFTWNRINQMRFCSSFESLTAVVWFKLLNEKNLFVFNRN